jgi:N-acetyl-gamma-glutamyl-phosphate reductase
MKSVAIVGANGYAGLELARLLLHHPQAKLAGVYGRSPEWQLAHDLPESKAAAIPYLPLDNLINTAHQFDTIFLATPASTSMQLAENLLAQNINVIDLSGAFRIPQQDFSQWYAEPHSATHLIEQAQYGLCPWWTEKENKNAIKLIANPGCFATCSLMALLPLFQANLIAADPIIIDAKSGISGAGRKVNLNLLFCEVNNDFYPYKIGQHQHTPEIIKYIKDYSQATIQPLLTTHVLPIKRGLLTSIYANISPNLQHHHADDVLQMITAAYANAYENYPLVKYQAIDKLSDEKTKTFTSLKYVTGSSRTHISYHIDNNKLILFSCIDNLLKGAASQAIENFNAINNWPLETGLLNWEGTL